MPAAIAAQSSRDRRQRDYVADTFGAPGEPTAHIGADAIATYLGGAAAGGRWVSGASIGQPIEAARPI
jgi:hypothetical protein